MNYINRLRFILYYLLNVFSYKFLSFKANVYNSVRVNGKKYISIGKNSIVQRHSWLLAMKIDNYEPKLEIHTGCAIGDFSHITCVRHVEIRDNVLIANNVYISDNQHGYEDVNTPVRYQPVHFKNKIIIDTGCWIGENVSVMASIGKNSVVAANSVVTKDIPDFCIAAGIPAKVIKIYNFKNKIWEKVNS